MKEKERVIAAVARKITDRLPHHLDFTWRMREKVQEYFHLSPAEVPTAFGNHLRIVDTHQKATIDRQRGMDYDLFGVGWDLVRSEGYLPTYHPLPDWEGFDTFSFPDPRDPRLYRDMNSLTAQEKEEAFILGSQGWVLMERAWLLRGFENFMMDIVDEREKLEALLDRVTEYQIEVSRSLIEMGVDGIYTGDDYGTQRGCLLAPATWRELIKPRLKRIWAVAKNEGLPVFHHSCGNVLDILDDMVEIGLDVLLPVQPQAMDIHVLADRYKDRLSFMGGVSTQTTLPFGTPTQVREEVRRCMEILGQNGGYIVSASHEIGSDCRMENLLAFLEELHDTNGSTIPLLSK